MKIKKLMVLLMAAVLTVGLLAGCKSDKDKDGEKTVNVSFDLNYTGAPAAPAAIQVKVGDKYTPLPTPSRDGFTFGGWFLNAGGSGAQVTADTDLTRETDHALYAVWVGSKVAVSFDLNYDGAPAAPGDKEVSMGGVYGMAIPDDPVREGFTFMGWYYDQTVMDGPVTNSTYVTEDYPHTLYARWQGSKSGFDLTDPNDLSYFTFDEDNFASVTAEIVDWNGRKAMKVTPTGGEKTNEVFFSLMGSFKKGDKFTMTVDYDAEVYNKYMTVDVNEWGCLGTWMQIYRSEGRTNRQDFYLEEYKDFGNDDPDGWRTWDGPSVITCDLPEDAEYLEIFIAQNSLPRDEATNVSYYIYDIGISGSTEKVNVSFDLNYSGAPAGPDGIEVVTGYTYGILPTPDKLDDGSFFDGWYLDSDGSGSKVTADTEVTNTGSHTLYAKWSKGGGDQLVISNAFDIGGLGWASPSEADAAAVSFDAEENCVRVDNVNGDDLICINILQGAPIGTVVSIDLDVVLPDSMDGSIYFSFARRFPKPDEWYLGDWGAKTGHVAEPASGAWPGVQTVTATLGSDCEGMYILVDFSEISNKTGASVYIRNMTFALPNGVKQTLDFSQRHFDIGGFGYGEPSGGDVAAVSFDEGENCVRVDNANGDDLVCINLLTGAPAGSTVSLRVDVGLPDTMDGSVYFSFARRFPKPDEWYLGDWGAKTGHVATADAGAWPGTQTITATLGSDCEGMFMLVDFSEVTDKAGSVIYIREVTITYP